MLLETAAWPRNLSTTAMPNMLDEPIDSDSDSDDEPAAKTQTWRTSEDNLRGYIKEYLESSDIKQKIHSILHHEGGRPYREGEILSRLQQKEIVDELVKTLQGSTSGSQVGSGAPPVVDSGRGARILLRLRGGVAFSDALRLSNSLGDEAGSEEDPLSFVQIHVCYAGQRFVSPAVPFTDRPELVAAFSMDMGTRSRNDYIAMLTKTPATPIHFVATRITKHDGDRPTIVVSLTVSPYAYSSICCQRSSY